MFDWDREFPEIMQAGGFDVVIGNPPYIRVHRLSPQDKSYLWSHYSSFVAKSDIFACFIEKGVHLLRREGRLAFITPNTWSSLESFTALRKLVLANTTVDQMVRTPEKVFRDATVKTFLFVLRRRTNPIDSSESKALIREMVEGGAVKDIRSVDQRDMESSHLSNLLLHSEDAAPSLFAKCMQSGATIGSRLEFYYGFKTADDDRFLATQRLTDFHKPFVRSADITRYGRLIPTGYVDYRPDVMRANRTTARPGDCQRFERPKVVVARMGKELIATLDTSGVFVKDAMLLLDPADSIKQLTLLVGLLNSRLLQYLYQNHFATIDVLKNALLALPVPNSFGALTGEVRYDKLAGLVERIVNLREQLPEAKTSHATTIIQRQIDTVDRQIDQLVYELYELKDEEIRIVEEGTK